MTTSLRLRWGEPANLLVIVTMPSCNYQQGWHLRFSDAVVDDEDDDDDDDDDDDITLCQ